MDIAYKYLKVFNCSYRLILTSRLASVLKTTTVEYLNSESIIQTFPHIMRWGPKGLGPSNTKTAESNIFQYMAAVYDALW
jgi:hypothetical protein